MVEFDILVRPEKAQESIAKALEKDWKVGYDQTPTDFLIFTDNFPVMAERKTCRDFINSVRDGHIIDQLRAMKQYSDDCYILLEGSWSWIFSEKNPYRSHFSEASVVGMLTAVDKFGVKIVPLSNQAWTVMWLDKRLRDVKGLVKKTDYKLRPSAAKDLSPVEQAEYIASGFPRLGPAGIEEVKSVFDNLGDFIEWANLDETAYDFRGNKTHGYHLHELGSKLSTRIRNLQDIWMTILRVRWNEQHKKEKHSESTGI
jgi:hypothetical protein